MKNIDRLVRTIQWWEKKRIWFNIFVGAVGIITVIAYGGFVYEPHYTIVQIIIWGFLANILYSSGILLEAANLHYFNGSIPFYKFKYFLFILGTFLYCVVTFMYAIFYYTSFW